MQGVDAAARMFADLFERHELPYAIMGGMAIRVYAIPRPTFDVDFTVAIDRDALPTLYEAAEALGFSIPTVQKTGWIDRVRDFPVVKFQWFIGDRAIDVDLFLAEKPFQHEVMRRRQYHGANGWKAWFVSPEDLILLKLCAKRPKDLVDIGDILFIQAALDEEYLRLWAARLDVLAELETALSQRA